jgi:hypothetical protein
LSFLVTRNSSVPLYDIFTDRFTSRLQD